jgi:hypothetical protein
MCKYPSYKRGSILPLLILIGVRSLLCVRSLPLLPTHDLFMFKLMIRLNLPSILGKAERVGEHSQIAESNSATTSS